MLGMMDMDEDEDEDMMMMMMKRRRRRMMMMRRMVMVSNEAVRARYTGRRSLFVFGALGMSISTITLGLLGIYGTVGSGRDEQWRKWANSMSVGNGG